MSKDSNETLLELTEIVENIVGLNGLVLELDMSATDVDGWDSLSHVQIIHACETKLGIRFTLEEISNLRKVDDLVNLINKHSNR